ncbi:phage head closure protein [Hansschlegelia beijingensis]|uniref:SPP1 family predicted phage head-tail adaptor n=1 Tax=Hansschlegelia beijingensis TaxID=1133344 RepID=A0A7W6CVL3_9HYPH|nr:SPP1 family predicted phage head-tail adaptor [Hansschlegelia beijingensis]
MSPGALRRRVTIEAPADAPDGAGGVVRGFAPLAQACAALEPVSAAEAEQGRAAGLRRLWRVTIRARGDVTGGCRLVWREKRFDVLSVRPLDADGRYEELLCEETAP